MGILQNSFQKGYQDEEADDQDEMPEGFDSIGGDAQLFYIGKNTSDHAPDISTLSKILGDYEDDIRPRRKKDKGKKKSKRKDNIDQHEMVPTTMGDDDEAPKKSKSGRYKKNTIDDEEHTDLQNVDLTKPLEEGETLFVRQHREVAGPSYDLGPREKDGKKGKKDKKDKKDKKAKKDKKEKEPDSPDRSKPKREKNGKKSSSSSKSGSNLSNSLNLLDLDFGGGGGGGNMAAG